MRDTTNFALCNSNVTECR